MYAGPKEGLVKKHDLGPEPFHGVDGFNGVLHDRQDVSVDDINLQNESAALGLVQLSKIHKEALHVICFAPLTNIALAMKVDENFAHRVRFTKPQILVSLARARRLRTAVLESKIHVDLRLGWLKFVD